MENYAGWKGSLIFENFFSELTAFYIYFIYAIYRYEAGYFGFRLHDCLVNHGISCIVTPPSLVPEEYGNRVKTDRRDSSKLAHMLPKGMGP
jgi:hypothetical protein